MYSVSAATEFHARLLSELGARLFEQAFGPKNTVENMRAYLSGAFSVESWAAELADPTRRTWLATDDADRPVGYVAVKRGTAPTPVTATDPVEIARLYADEHCHGRGVGELLLRACFDQARAWNSDLVWLGVWEENARGIAFYHKHGFQIVGSQSFQLGSDVQRDHLMTRRLD